MCSLPRFESLFLSPTFLPRYHSNFFVL
jgi:hypothetical protein